MRRALKFAFVALLLFAAVALAFGYHAAAWLKRADAPGKADAIVVLAGPYTRSMHAADLYRAGHAPKVVLSEAVREKIWSQLDELGIKLPSVPEVHRRVLQAKGVPAERIEPLGPPALSTADEARAIAQRFGKPGSRVIVVTTPAHVMRARLIIERALEGRGVKLMVCATPYEAFPDAWWRSQDAARDVLLEWVKIAFFVAGGRFSAGAGT
ncbi:MAG: YdcF family protein [Betaproteobacteria bacterium]|nr:YdcF family protein [Betaproteobacteria bacterium]